MKFFISGLQAVTLISQGVILFFALSQAWLAFYYRRSKIRQTQQVAHPVWQGSLPRILVQLPIFNEKYVVERLLEAVAHLDYPPHLLTIQVLDDSTDDTSEIAAASIARWSALGIKIDHVRRGDRCGYKAGALRAGLALNDSEFVTIFDADFIPQPRFLKDAIGYFNDPSLGLVQTRWAHLNENASLLTKLLSFAIDCHFSIEQGGRQATKNFINFNGTAGMWRRKAIDEAGGWQDDCLTEDLDLSFRSQLRGWKFLFVESITTPSELPARMSAIRSQQYRWTKGAAETGRKTLKLLWSSRQTPGTKIIGSFHMLNSVVFPFLLVLSLVLVPFPFVYGEQMETAFGAIYAMMAASLFAMMFTYWTAQSYGDFDGLQKSGPSILLRAFLFLLMVCGLSVHNSRAVFQGLLGRRSAFVRTPKFNCDAKGRTNPGTPEYAGEVFKWQNAVEVCLMLLFTGLMVYSAAHGHVSLVLVYAYFASGYAMVSYFTVSEILADRMMVKTSKRELSLHEKQAAE